MKKVAFLFAAVLMASCSVETVQSIENENKAIEADLKAVAAEYSQIEGNWYYTNMERVDALGTVLEEWQFEGSIYGSFGSPVVFESDKVWKHQFLTAYDWTPFDVTIDPLDGSTFVTEAFKTTDGGKFQIDVLTASKLVIRSGEYYHTFYKQ